MTTATLTTGATRAVTPYEAYGLIIGTGALTWPWWKSVNVIRRNGPVTTTLGYDEREDKDAWTGDEIFHISSWAKGEEGGHLETDLTTQQIVEAFQKALETDLLDPLGGDVKDMIAEDLGYADAMDADIVLQLAVFSELVYS
jgi:hypothetical protein